MVLTLKKKKDNKKLMKVMSVFIIVVFVSSVFIVFVQDNSVESEKKFYLRIQVKDYTNPLQGDVIFNEGFTLEEVLSSYNIQLNQTCVTLDYIYCNDESYIWRLYTNGLLGQNLSYIPKEGDQIIFKYERI